MLSGRETEAVYGLAIYEILIPKMRINEVFICEGGRYEGPMSILGHFLLLPRVGRRSENLTALHICWPINFFVEVI